IGQEGEYRGGRRRDMRLAADDEGVLHRSSPRLRWLPRLRRRMDRPRGSLPCPRMDLRSGTRHRAQVQDRRAPLRRLEISLSHGAEWTALISRYIGTIPLSGDASCAVAHIIAICPPPRTPVSSAMIAKAGAAARHSQSAAPRAAVLPLS